MIYSHQEQQQAEGSNKAFQSHRYQIISDRLKYEETSILYTAADKTYRIDLSQLVFPATTGSLRSLRMSEEPAYVDLALALADRRIAYSRVDSGIARAITRQLYLIRNVLDWLRGHGIYRLVDATTEDIQEMMKEYAAGGWAGALNLVDRWHRALDVISPDDLTAGFHYYKKGGGIEHVDSLSAPFWRSRIGWGGSVPLPTEIKERINGMVSAPLSEEWIARTAPSDPRPGRNVIRNVLTLMNDWVCLPESVDRLRHRVAPGVRIVVASRD